MLASSITSLGDVLSLKGSTAWGQSRLQGLGGPNAPVALALLQDVVLQTQLHLLQSLEINACVLLQAHFARLTLRRSPRSKA